MMDTRRKIIKKIKDNNIRPTPKYRFIIKRSVIWTVFCLSIMLGCVACAVAIFQLRYAEWDLYRHFRHSWLEFLLLVFPVFWLVFLLGFSGTAYYYFRRMEHGYRYRTVVVVSLNIILSVIGGGLLYSTGLPEKIEPLFFANLPFYKELQIRKQYVWMSPAKGLLAGGIISFKPGRKIVIEDLRGNSWDIDISDVVWRGRLRPREGLKIKLIGQKTGDGRFRALEIRPWLGRHHRMCRGRRRGHHGMDIPKLE